MWTLAYGQHEDRTPTHGYAAPREAAMAAFAKSWPTGPSWRNHRSLADFATIEGTRRPSVKQLTQLAPSIVYCCHTKMYVT
jgi:hypothetical protein